MTGLKWNNLTALCLFLALCFVLAFPVTAEESVPNYKCTVLNQRIEDSDNPQQLFDVAVEFQLYKNETLSRYTQQASEQVQEEINRLFGGNFNYAALRGYNVAQQNCDRFYSLMAEYVDNAVEEVLNFAKADRNQVSLVQIPKDYYAASFEGQFTKEQIAHIKSHEKVRLVRSSDCVECIPAYDTIDNLNIIFFNTVGVFGLETWVGSRGELSQTKWTYAYNAVDALRMLQIAVGKTPNQPIGVPEFVNDPNEDGKVNATDALLALQHSVGKRYSYFHLPIDWAYPTIGCTE